MAEAGAPRFGSDVVVDLLARLEVPYVALNPGASFRGLHDSLVNRPGAPAIITCPHEKLAVQIAHGYAKASGRMMAACLHDTVGLLHGSLGIFSAFLDRVPVLVLGGAGPMDTARRRPWVDWTHTSLVQGNAVRGFTKWDDQPVSVDAFPEAFARAGRVARQEPAGPVYVALDADLQEQPAREGLAIPGAGFMAPASRLGADPSALAAAATALVDAARPAILAAYAARDPRAFEWIPRLAELTGAAMIDDGYRLNLPNRHPQALTMADALEDADLVLLLDVKDPSPILGQVDKNTRTVQPRTRPGTRIVDVGFNELHTSAWVQHHGQLTASDIAVTADTSVVLPELIELVEALLAAEGPERAAAREARRRVLAERSAARRAAWAGEAGRRHDERPAAPSRLAEEVWAVIREHDWVLTAGTADDWARRLWEMDRPYRHAGRSLGTATQIGISLGVALAHKGSGRLVVDLQPDGDLMFDPGALWVAAAHRIPMLIVMYNNRAYYNDWDHQIRMARKRGSDMGRVNVGVEIDGPAPDFAQVARGFGWHAEGPIEDPDRIRDAVARAARVVLNEDRPALVDVVCQHR